MKKSFREEKSLLAPNSARKKQRAKPGTRKYYVCLYRKLDKLTVNNRGNEGYPSLPDEHRVPDPQIAISASRTRDCPRRKCRPPLPELSNRLSPRSCRGVFGIRDVEVGKRSIHDKL